ncbi:Hsp20/alpha crystallin family protein [Aliikangiella sp. IMCC44653]
MNLSSWNPLREIDDFLTPSLKLRNSQASTGTWKPLVDVGEDANEYLIKVEVPEIPKENLKITTNNGYLTISGERTLTKSDKKMHTMERFYGTFERSFNLPENVDERDIRAEYHDGVLELHLQKNQLQQQHPHQIEIK